MLKTGEVVTFKTVSEKAKVSRQYLYKEFADMIVTLRNSTSGRHLLIQAKECPPRSSGRAEAIEKALRMKIEEQKNDLVLLRSENTVLRRRYEKALGESEEWRTRHLAALAELEETRSRLSRWACRKPCLRL